jgi:voltage-gated sodium channel
MKTSTFKEPITRLLNWPHFESLVLILIVLNSIILALETSKTAMAVGGDWLFLIDRIFLGIFVLELAMRLAADFRGFWRDPWRIFDFFVVTIALLPSTGPLSILRALRILRVLRLISSIPAMRRVVSGLLSAMPGMASIVLLIALIFFVFSVISTKLFGESFPEWFGTLGESAYTLFQVMTLESWSMGIVRPVMDVYPYAWVLFVPFIILTAFTVLNLFIGVIVDAMQTEHESAAKEERGQMITDNEAILRELRELKAEVAALRSQS